MSCAKRVAPGLRESLAATQVVPRPHFLATRHLPRCLDGIGATDPGRLHAVHLGFSCDSDGEALSTRKAGSMVKFATLALFALLLILIAMMAVDPSP